MTNTALKNNPQQRGAFRPWRYITRDHLLALLTPEEAILVSEAEAHARVASGESYLDLHRLERGVLTANGSASSINNVLPMRAVSEDLWRRILALTPSRS